ncbi:MAG: arsenite methyltransferase [Chloroflexaceae bacterium]|jgi:SAM-dependent methyltransferase|nr:arsenite methyltransferase [Chloroflexaceae bacterium]
MSIQDAETIKASVRDHYGNAIQQRSSCCGTNSTAIELYGSETVAQLSDDVSAPSFGCGNPIALASLKPGEVVLDLGSGGGLDVLLAAQRVGAQGFVYGLDMTDAMLETARRNVAKAGVTNVEFRKGDIEAMPLPDASVDVIISNCVINLAPDKGQVLREARRVLRHGGRLAVSDIVVDGSLAELPVSEAEIRAALSWVGCIAGALTVEEYKRLLFAAGFSTAEIVIQQHYSPEYLLRNQPEALGKLSPEVVAALVGRFASGSITAVA